MSNMQKEKLDFNGRFLSSISHYGPRRLDERKLYSGSTGFQSWRLFSWVILSMPLLDNLKRISEYLVYFGSGRYSFHLIRLHFNVRIQAISFYVEDSIVDKI
jgi:hypothetical protein